MHHIWFWFVYFYPPYGENLGHNNITEVVINFQVIFSTSKSSISILFCVVAVVMGFCFADAVVPHLTCSLGYYLHVPIKCHNFSFAYCSILCERGCRQNVRNAATSQFSRALRRSPRLHLGTQKATREPEFRFCNHHVQFVWPRGVLRVAGCHRPVLDTEF